MTTADAERRELWEVSVRRYNARQSEDRRLERLRYHEGQARRLSNTLEALVRYHEAEAARYRNGKEALCSPNGTTEATENASDKKEKPHVR